MSILRKSIVSGVFSLVMGISLVVSSLSAAPAVKAVKLPFDGLRPQAVRDQAGVVHIVQSSSKTRGALVYVKHLPDSNRFSRPISVLTDAKDMAASYNMAVGKDGRVHVLTRPNPKYSIKKLGKKKFDEMFHSKARFFVLKYMLHSRLNDAGTAFEEETNIVGDTIGFEGVGAVIADPRSDDVYLVWPGQLEPGPETGRDMYMAVSKDAGKTWSQPRKLDLDIEGNCRCCPIQGAIDAAGNLFVLNRNSVRTTQTSWDKDTFLLVSKDAGKTWSKTLIEKWKNCGCPGAPYSVSSGPSGVFFGFSTRGTSSFANANDPTKIIPAPNTGKATTRPTVVVNKNGELLFAWVEVRDVVWQVYDKNGKPIRGVSGRLTNGAAKWSNPAAVATGNGDFLLYYDGEVATDRVDG